MFRVVALRSYRVFNGSYKGEEMMAKVSKVKIEENGPAGFVYFITYIGAAIYFVSISNGFWGFIGALLKAAVWPAYLVNRVLEVLRIGL
jgi:hypothetical protein